ncbi:hypothetical protein HDE69_004943 [Pedobacter cryoconitis]|uniref:Uncharacterized protein n=1 Tax=Pedobacter cryoconitis TaxID=188932 RepID=A0A7W8YY01_9SPHI|nr:hypothetical protein [Pedobacter cryoconitis]MBB5623855.1 hypothetical protein [Pedobacter cryoconitis]
MMKNFYLITMIAAGFILLNSCKKDKTAVNTPDVLTAKAFTFNTAIGQTGPDTILNGELNSTVGIRLIYFYLMRSDKTDSLIYRDTPAQENRNLYRFSIPAKSFSAAKLTKVTGIKVMVKHIDNSSFEGLIKMTAFTPPMPTLTDIPASILPDETGKVLIKGKANSENGLKLIEFYDDSKGAFEKADQIALTKNEKTYELSYQYTYRKNAGKIKIVITDSFGLKAEALINIPIKSYVLYKDLTMMAHGTASAPSASSFFNGETGSLLGSCSVSGQEQKVDFVTYCTTAMVFSLYSPASATTITKNYKCNTQIWEPDPASLKATKFRVLIPGSVEADRVYAAYNANTIIALDDQFFEGITAPGSSTAKFDAATANQAANVFNTTSAYLIWVRVPKPDGTFTNQLLSAKSVVIGSPVAVSTIKFDILVSK